MKVRYIIMTAAVALGLQGCSDWDDHYDATGNNIPGADATLWQQINSRPEISNFATLLKKVGYDEVLNTNQCYTVWAPNNDAYDFETYNAMSDSLLKAEFLNNHIARGYHRASGDINERVHFLNKKVLSFAGDGEYTLGGNAVKSANILSKNGMMHLLDGMMEFRPNFYDYFNREHTDGFKSTIISDLFMSNMKREMDKENSVEGPIKDGEITYLDTVFVETNKWFDLLNAELTTEDSTYTMVIPSDIAWEKAYKHIEPLYKYPAKIQPFTLKNDENNDLTYTVAGKQDIDADSLKRTYTQLGILSSLIYSNTVNPALRDGSLPTGATDSIKSTAGNYMYNTLNYRDQNSSFVNDAQELFTDTRKETLSNGIAWLADDSLYLKPWTNLAVNPVMCVRAMNGSKQAAVRNVELAQNVTVNANELNPKVHGSIHATAYYQVNSSLGKTPEVYFYGPALNSTAYAVYLTMIPQNITDTTAVPVAHKIQLFSITHKSSGDAPAKAKDGIPALTRLKKDFHSNSNQGAVTFDYGTEESARIVSKFMGVFKPNISYHGLSTTLEAFPIFNVKCMKTTGDITVLRIAAITFVPQEAVEYYLNKGVIDSYTDEMPEMFWNLTTSY